MKKPLSIEKVKKVQNLTVGTLVQLLSGSPTMTITHFDEKILKVVKYEGNDNDV